MTSRTETAPQNTGLDDVAHRLRRRPWPAIPIRSKIQASFEYFPPATTAAQDGFVQCADKLAPLKPRFVSITYGAGGTTQSRTVDAIQLLAQRHDTPVAGHLTCVGATKDQVAKVVDTYIHAGVRHIVALRGDAPAGMTDGSVEGGYRDATELVAGLRQHVDELGDGVRHNFEISVAAYPEVHPKAASPSADLDNLKRKLDAGANRAITQFFFDTDHYLRFLDRARKAGIAEPIVPGIMPVTGFANVVRFSKRCGTSVPKWMHDLFAGLDDAPEIRQLVAATVAAEQCRRLAEHGVTEFHFYTMNKPELTEAICRIIGAAGESVNRPTELERSKEAS